MHTVPITGSVLMYLCIYAMDNLSDYDCICLGCLPEICFCVSRQKLFLILIGILLLLLI